MTLHSRVHLTDFQFHPLIKQRGIHMATSTFRNKNEVRPKKQGAAKRKRIKDQKKRLIALGMKPENVEKMQSNELRDWLRRPKQTKAILEAAAAGTEA